MGSGGNAAGASGNAGATGAAGTGAAGTGAAGATGNTIMGSADGTPFTNATTVLWIGAPDSAASTVVYVFSAPIKCSEISKVGWDTRVADKTQALELKMIGTTAPATFTVVMSPTPAPGQASVNYTLTSQTGTPGEVISSGGTVTLSALKASTSATGSFDLQFGANALKGAFMATYCATGVEP